MPLAVDRAFLGLVKELGANQPTLKRPKQQHAGSQVADIASYEKADGSGVPILKLPLERGPNAHEIVHSDLNAIV